MSTKTPVADRLVEEEGGHGGIDAAGEAADHAAPAHLVADAGDRLSAVGVHRPVAGEAADAEQEVLEQRSTDRGVDHLGVELEPVEAALLVGDRGEGRGVAAGDRDEALGDRHDPVAVAHPDGRALAGIEDAREQRRGAVEADLGAAVLALRGGLDPAAELGAHGLLAVADAEHGHAQLEHGRWCPGAQGLVGRGGAAREDDRGGREAGDEQVVDGAGVDLAVDAVLAHAARDQLGVLRAEVEDQDALGHAPP